MVTCPACGAQNPDNAKFCCQCASAVSLGRRVFVPMCGEEAESNEKNFLRNETASSFQNMNNGGTARRPEAGNSAFALKDSEDDESDYAKFRMRDSSEVFNGEESNIFSKNSRDKAADRKRRKDAARLVKNAEKKRKENPEEDVDTSWQGNDFWR